jgi:hypothetical protein
MSALAQIKYYEELVIFEAAIIEEENPRLAEYVCELRGAWEHRAVLRHLRIRQGIGVCNGDGHCLNVPTAHCMAGRHETCPEHTDSCYLCEPLAAVPTEF